MPIVTGKGAGRLRNQRISEDHSHYSIIKIKQNTEKSPGSCHLVYIERPSANISAKILQGVIIIKNDFFMPVNNAYFDFSKITHTHTHTHISIK